MFTSVWFLTCLMFLPESVFGWNRLGHEAVGMTVMSALQPKAMTQLKRILKNKDVVDVATWGHRLNERFPSTIPLNYQAQPTKECKTLDLSVCANDQCLLHAVKHFYGRLANLPDNVILEYPEDLPFTDAEILKLFISLIADLHQPLHLGFDEDDCGRNLKGTYEAGAQKLPTSLHDYWEAVVIDKYANSRSNFWYGGWTHVNSLGKSEIERERKIWDEAEDKFAVFESWATESMKLACKFGYTESRHKSQAVSEPIKPGFHFDARDEFVVFENIKSQILKCGLRLSLALNTILQARDAAKLRQGVSVIAEEVPAHRTNLGHAEWMRNVMTNLSLVILVLAVFVYIAKFYSPSSEAPRYRVSKTQEDKNF